ncbi:hypothetical protein LSTR_LSTR001959 [Laodelphax striatellus]|uniref:Uncharacterized protein n=1 Tax=Laodelphax striatellus TaxID=195883 RepID=A0A482XI33_LAOST|nr:hypothetical protein LSTR_LSTR001959 [Laodelphax striatellus]
MHKLMPSSFIDSLLRREYKDDIKLNAKIVNDRLRDAQNLYNKDLVSHYGCVNAVEFLNGGQYLVSGGDDQRVLLWNVQEALQGISKPKEMRAQHVSNIFCLGYDSKNTRLFSSGNDEQVIIHDIQTGDPVDVFRHHNPVYGLSVDPTNDFVFASACDDGSISIYDIRRPASSGPFLLNKSSSAYHGVQHNPVEPRLLATANAKEGACLWDSRIPNKALLKYGSGGGGGGSGGCMAVRWSGDGCRLVALRRRLPPVLYALHSAAHVAQFDHPGYFNSCTMKSCCFAGLNDQYVLSGSDDFNLYMWKVPAGDQKGVWVPSAHLVLVGHRSIVNQVRFCPENNLIASSGVEKIIKIIDHDYSHESMDEDPRMMAFFDSLVQREIECWTSDDSDRSQQSKAVKVMLLNGAMSTDDDDEDTEEEEDGGVVVQENEEEEEEEEEDGEEGVRRKRRLPQESREDVHSPNPIVKLIARKRAQLMRMAKRKKEALSSSCSTSNKTSTASASDDSSSADSNVNGNNSDAGSSKVNCVIFKKKRLMRLRKRMHTAYNDSSDEDEETAASTAVASSAHPPSKLRRRTSDATCTTTEAAACSSSHKSPPAQAAPASTREGETPDSGIYVLSDEQTTNGSFKKRSNSNRNYRRRILSSDSD